MGERSSAIEDVDIQYHEFTDTEESTKEELKQEVWTPSNQAQKDAFNELAKAKLLLIILKWQEKKVIIMEKN